MRKFGYSEHCVYTGAMLSFIYIAYLVSGNSLSGAKVFGDAFLVFLLWVFSKIGFGERKFSADWFSGREKFSGDMRSIGNASWCVE